MKKINILLTFDYELPLGGVKHSYQQSLFNPTDRLLGLGKKLDVPIVLFADILSYMQFLNWDKENYSIPFANQIQAAISQNHDVQLHLHPHWLTSTFKDGTFIPSESFELADFANEPYPNNIQGIIQRSIAQLDVLCKEQRPDYKCIAFRAGGYNLQQHTDTILKELYKNGIRFDSSISKGYYFKSSISKVDYRATPKPLNWYLNYDGSFEKSGAPGGILEIPIASKPKGLFEIPTRFKLKKYSFRAVDERGSMIHSNTHVKLADKLHQLLASRMLTVDNHTYASDYMMNILKYNVKLYRSYDEIYLSLIGHPKSMGDYAFQLLADFVNRSREVYKDSINFCTFTDLYQQGIHENYSENG